MATYSSTNYLANGALVRSSSSQPEWFSFTYQVPTTLTLATGDVIKFAKMGANQQVIAYTIGANGSIASGTGTDGTLTVGSTDIVSAAIANFGGNDSTVGGFVSVDHVSANEDDLKVTLGTLSTPTTSGTRSINLRVLVAAQEMQPSVARAPLTFPTLAP